MGIFGSLKNRMMGRRESFEDIRSYVVGAAQQPEQPAPRPGRFDSPANRFGAAEEDVGPPIKSYEEQQLGFDEPTEPSFVTRRPLVEEPKPSYDILDRLNIIEAQLSAIRSQTETINERLKNMEVRLTGRRY
ncbi:MAG: hypothetical protein HYT72_02665 [Candidatus Aenigmarchaeota archaeon]|nr:hypothetical protein [Candidatus Aenigmarchaeota archaeon]